MDPTKEYAVKKDESGAVSVARQIPPQKQEKKKTNYRLPTFIVLSLLLFLTISSLFQFKDKLFDTLFPKPPSSASEDKWKNYDDALKEGKIKKAGKILEVKLSYDEAANPKINIVKLTKKNGYAPVFVDKEGFEIQLLNEHGHALFSKHFKPPAEEHYDYLKEDGSIGGGSSKKDKFDFILVLPFYDDATELSIQGLGSVNLSKKSLKDKDIENIDNKPDFQTINGGEFVNESQTFNFKFPFTLKNPLKIDVSAQTRSIFLVKPYLIYPSDKPMYPEYETAVKQYLQELQVYYQSKVGATFQMTPLQIKRSAYTYDIMRCDPYPRDPNPPDSNCLSNRTIIFSQDGYIRHMKLAINGTEKFDEKTASLIFSAGGGGFASGGQDPNYAAFAISGDYVLEALSGKANSWGIPCSTSNNNQVCNINVAKGAVAHELGHGFTLQHPNLTICNQETIMYTGGQGYSLLGFLSEESQLLRQSPFFTGTVPINPLPVPCISEIDGNDKDGRLDLTFIGDDYTSSDLNPGGKFHSDVSLLINKLFTFEPFKSRKEQIDTNKVLNSRDLNCYVLSGTQIIECDRTLAKQEALDKSAPVEQLVVLYNKDVVAGKSLPEYVAVGMDPQLAGGIFVHELGHAFAGLEDEYVNPSGITYPKEINCTNNKPNSSWEAIGNISYNYGCSGKTSWRSSPDSIMRSFKGGADYYNSLSQYWINLAIDNYVEGNTAGTGGSGNLPGDSCSDPIKPNGCECTSNSQCNTNYCSKDRNPWKCAEAPPSGDKSDVCGWTQANVTVSNTYLGTPSTATDSASPTTIGRLINPVYKSFFTCDAKVDLTCVDNSGGVGCDSNKSPKYCIDTDNTCTPDKTGNFSSLVSTEGKGYIRYRSVDKAGNLEGVKSLTFSLDRSIPVGRLEITSTGYKVVNNQSRTYYIQGQYDESGIKKTECYLDSDLIYTETNPSYVNRCHFVFQNVSLGIHTVTAKFYDNVGWWRASTGEIEVAKCLSVC